MGKKTRQDGWTDAISLCITGFTRFHSHRYFQLESFLMSTRIPAPIFFFSPALQLLFLFSFREGHTQKQETGNLTIAQKILVRERTALSRRRGKYKEGVKEAAADSELTVCMQMKDFVLVRKLTAGSTMLQWHASDVWSSFIIFHFTWFRSTSLATVCGPLNPFQTFGLHSH